MKNKYKAKCCKVDVDGDVAYSATSPSWKLPQCSHNTLIFLSKYILFHSYKVLDAISLILVWLA